MDKLKENIESTIWHSLTYYTVEDAASRIASEVKSIAMDFSYEYACSMPGFADNLRKEEIDIMFNEFIGKRYAE